MVSILQLLLLFSELLSISQVDVYCLEEAASISMIPSISSLLNSVQSEASLDRDGRRYFENRSDFPGFLAQAVPEENEVFNSNVNSNTNLRLPWSQSTGRTKGRKRGLKNRRPMKEPKRKQDLKQIMQIAMPRSTLSQSSVTFDTNAVKQNGRRTKTRKCHDSSEEEDVEPDSASECNCNIGSKILRQIRQLKYQLDVTENLVYDNFNLDDDI